MKRNKYRAKANELLNVNPKTGLLQWGDLAFGVIYALLAISVAIDNLGDR
jgi:hypothetical protein